MSGLAFRRITTFTGPEWNHRRRSTGSNRVMAVVRCSLLCLVQRQSLLRGLDLSWWAWRVLQMLHDPLWHRQVSGVNSYYRISAEGIGVGHPKGYNIPLPRPGKSRTYIITNVFLIAGQEQDSDGIDNAGYIHYVRTVRNIDRILRLVSLTLGLKFRLKWTIGLIHNYPKIKVNFAIFKKHTVIDSFLF